MPHVRPSHDRTTLEVVLADGSPLPIHPLWLRERSADPASLDAQTEQRLFNPSDVAADTRITLIRQPTDEEFDITFSDGHRCLFLGRKILAELPDLPGDLPAPVAWSTADKPPAPTDWPTCQTDAGCLAALHDYHVYGYVIIQQVPRRPGAVMDVARRFGFPRETNFGTMFDVRSVPHAIDLAYTALPLDPHTDNPYRGPVPGIQLLHCLTNDTPGGLSTLVDGMAVASALRAEAPDLFAVLTATPVRFRYVDANTELVSTAPLIELDHAGRFVAIHYSPRLDFVPLLPPETLETFYAARRLLDRMLKSSSFERRFKLDDGHLMMFDNRRLLHGRTGFDPTAGMRHLQGCYIDADGPGSLYRVLRRRLG
jgi:gamma-butyrobetaine dioxygenase